VRLETLIQDGRFAVRMAARNPGTTLLAVVCLALGIGANGAIFSVVNAVLLRPYSFSDPDRLFVIWEHNPETGRPFLEVAYRNFADWRSGTTRFQRLAAMHSVEHGFVLTGQGEPALVRGRGVSGGFFEVLGVEPALGRSLLPEDDRPESPLVAVLSHGFWQRQLGGDPGILGRALVLDGRATTVVGIMPPGFAYPRGTELWVAMVPTFADLVRYRKDNVMLVVGRLRPDATVPEARAELDVLIHGIYRDACGGHVLCWEALRGNASVVRPLLAEMLGPARPTLWVLALAVGLVLLMACANVSALLLVRATERRQELAIRQALGASRGRIAMQLFVESLLLSAVAGLAGLAVAALTLRAVVALGPADAPRIHDSAVDGAVLVFTLAACALTALLVGSLPVLNASRLALRENLNEGGRSASSPLGLRRSQALLVVGETAVALLVLVGAGLTARSFVQLHRVDLGFDARKVLALELSLPDWKYPDAERKRSFQRRLLDRLRELPGVEAAGGVLLAPFSSGTVGYDWYVVLEGQSDEQADTNPQVNLESVTPGYFRAMSIALRSGRTFTEDDGPGAPGVAIVGESLARRLWPGEDAVGMRLNVPLNGPPTDDSWFTVVGVVSDVRYRELEASRYDVYLPYGQCPFPIRFLVARTRPDPMTLAEPARAEVGRLDSELPLTRVTSMAEVVAEQRGRARFLNQTFLAFGTIALLLAVLGIYGLAAHTVERRRREMGIRLALGAEGADLVWMVLRRGLALAAAGLAVGTVAALAGTRVLSGLLFEVSPTDPATLAAAALLLAAVALVASYIPARRAARVDPVVALRTE
jgi:putative ABC transport system permease protein